MSVGGIEVIGYDPKSRTYRCHFFDSEGGTSIQQMRLGDGTVTWEGDGTRCESTFEDDGRTLVAHHEPFAENGAWVPSMEVPCDALTSGPAGRRSASQPRRQSAAALKL